MKLTLKITGVFLIFALLTSCVAATESKDLPTKQEITDFIAGIPVSDNYINTVYDAVIDKHPAWNCDIWEDKNGNQILSLYYVDSDSAKGYGSIYFDKSGKEISTRGVELDSVDSYVGKAVPEEPTTETTSVDTTPVDTPADSTKEESATDQEQSEPIQELSESIQELSEPIQEQHVIVQEQSVQEKYELIEYEQTVIDNPKKVTGQLIFDPSEKMKVGKTENVDVYITTDIAKNISEEYGINETLQSRNISVTPRMKVTLVGGETGAFYIETIPPNSDGVQPVIGNNTTIWSWQVTPLKSGKQTLLLSIEYVIPLNNGDDQHYKTLKNMEEQIYVEISPYYFVECNWQWIIGIIIVPVLLAKYTSRKDQNKSNIQPPKKVD